MICIGSWYCCLAFPCCTVGDRPGGRKPCPVTVAVPGPELFAAAEAAAAPAAAAGANLSEHETSRTGGRAVHGIVPTAFEFRWAQCRVGLPRDSVTEKRATAGKKAVETPGGGRDCTSSPSASSHRRAVSRSGGATRAERDGRPVNRRNGLSGAFVSPQNPRPRPPTVPGFRDRARPRAVCR
jgi:hypothetical protein